MLDSNTLTTDFSPNHMVTNFGNKEPYVKLIASTIMKDLRKEHLTPEEIDLLKAIKDCKGKDWDQCRREY